MTHDAVHQVFDFDRSSWPLKDEDLIYGVGTRETEIMSALTAPVSNGKLV